MSLILDGTNGLSDVDGSAGTPAIRGSDTNTGIFFDADIIGFSEGGTECARFNADAQFVAAAGTASLPVITTTGDVNTGIFFPAADTIAFAEGGAERARIDSSGSLLVGTTSAWFGRRFVSESPGEAGVFISNAAASGPLDMLNTATSGNNVFSNFFTEARGAPTTRGSIDFNRAAGLTRYNTTSDATLKNLIGDADGVKSVELLSTTRIREYAWKSDLDQKPQIGVIAQELYETFKGAVSVGGEKEDGTYRPWGVDKTAFTFHLIAGWQAHQKIIEEQQAIITALTARVEALEGVQP